MDPQWSSLLPDQYRLGLHAKRPQDTEQHKRQHTGSKSYVKQIVTHVHTDRMSRNWRQQITDHNTHKYRQRHIHRQREGQ